MTRPASGKSQSSSLVVPEGGAAMSYEMNGQLPRMILLQTTMKNPLLTSGGKIEPKEAQA